MTHGPNDRAGAPGPSGRTTPPERPAHLSRVDARRIAAELLDDVLRHGERVDGSGVSNAAVAESLALGESRVRRFRDPHEDATVSLADLLLLPEAVARPLLAALRARRRELYGEPAAPSTREDQAHVTLATAGATIQCLAQALTDGVITDEEAPRIAAQARGLMRDLERLVTRCGAEGP